MIKVPFYNGDIYDSHVVGHLTIKQWIDAQLAPKPHIVELMDKIREATSKKDLKLKQELKTKLYYITPAVYIEKGAKRRYSSIKYFTGLCQLDFDKLNSIKEARELRDYIFEMYDPIVCAYLSPSKLGVKAIMRIPRCQDVEEYKDYYAAIEDEMKMADKGFDHAPINCVLPLFISVDRSMLWRDDATVWDVKKDRTVDYVHLNAAESDYGRGMADFEKSLKTVEFFKSKIDEIVSDSGHPRLRSACLVLGSRAGANYIDLQQCYELAEYMISTNQYLNKKRSTYLKTALWCIDQGYGNAQYY